MSTPESFLPFIQAGGIVTIFGVVGHRALRLFEFDRIRFWGAIADWAAANEAAARYRQAVRKERPWREWQAFYLSTEAAESLKK